MTDRKFYPFMCFHFGVVEYIAIYQVDEHEESF